VPVAQILKDMDRRARSTVSKIITSSFSKRLIEGNNDGGYKLTALGHTEASSIIQNWMQQAKPSLKPG